MSQKPLAFLLPLFGADQNLLTKRCMFGKGGVVGVNFTGVEEGGGLAQEVGVVCKRERGGWGGGGQEEPWC